MTDDTSQHTKLRELQLEIAGLLDTTPQSQAMAGSLNALAHVAVRLAGIFGCPFQHPTTGNPCVEEGLHSDHRAMGTERFQLFGPHIAAGTAPTGQET